MRPLLTFLARRAASTTTPPCALRLTTAVRALTATGPGLITGHHHILKGKMRPLLTFLARRAASTTTPPYALRLTAAVRALTATGPGSITGLTPESLVDSAAASLARGWALGALSDADGDALLRSARDGASLATMRRETGSALSAVDGVPLVVGPRFGVAGALSPGPPGGGPPCPPAAVDAHVVARARALGFLPIAQAAWEPGAPGAAGGVGVPSSHHATAARAEEAAVAAGGAQPWVAAAGGGDAPPTLASPSARVTCLPAGGGPAAAVVVGAASGGLTADALGTARLAAAWTGTVCCVPTPGRLGRGGLASAIGARLDVPALATRTVADAALLLGLLQEGGGKRSPCPGAAAVAALASDRPADLDGAAAPLLVHLLLTGEAGAAGRARAEGWKGDHALPPLGGLRVAVPAGEDGLALSPPARAALRAAAGALAGAGAHVFPVGRDRFYAPPGAGAASYTLAAGTALACAAAAARGAGHPLPGLGVVPGGREEQHTPALLAAAAAAREVAHAVCAARARAGAPAPGSADQADAAARRARSAAARTARSLFADGTAHVVLTPAAPGVAPTVADAARAGRAWLAQMDELVAPGCLGGLPTVVVPVGVCKDTGLPVGVAVHAGPGRDAVALAAAAVVEGVGLR